MQNNSLYVTIVLAATVLCSLIPIRSAIAQKYWVYVAAESEDEVYLVTYDADRDRGEIADTVTVGQYLTEIEGPHGINVDPNGDYWYLSVAHGNPYGWLYKFKTGSNEFVERTELGMFPASMEVSSKTGLLYVVNFNLHGDMEPSTVSVIHPETMTRVADINTGIMPHGSRISSDGKYQYHVSMMTDELIEVNTVTMEVSRRLNIAKGQQSRSMGMNPDMHDSGQGHSRPVAKPTWADPHPSKPFVYVANNGSDEAVEVHTDTWKIARRFNTGKAPYNLEVSHDGKLLVISYKGEGATGVWDLDSGKELAKIPNSRTVTHGVSISPDNRYAFMSVEGKNAEPGSVDVIDLEKLERVEVIEVGKQAGGIIHWKMEE